MLQNCRASVGQYQDMFAMLVAMCPDDTAGQDDSVVFIGNGPSGHLTLTTVSSLSSRYIVAGPTATGLEVA